MIDADGQHPAEMIETFIREWQAGYATVIGVRTTDGGAGFMKSLGSRGFYLSFDYLAPTTVASTD